MPWNSEMKNQCENDIPCTSQPRKLGIPGRQTVEHQRSIMALKLIKSSHHADTPGHKRRGVLSTFYDPCPLKLRKLDPQAVGKLKVNKGLPFYKMNPNASDIVLVNSLYFIEIAVKGSALQMQMKDFTHICFFYSLLAYLLISSELELH